MAGKCRKRKRRESGKGKKVATATATATGESSEAGYSRRVVLPVAAVATATASTSAVQPPDFSNFRLLGPDDDRGYLSDSGYRLLGFQMIGPRASRVFYTLREDRESESDSLDAEENEGYKWETVIGLQTPHGSKIKEREEREVAQPGADCKLTPLKVRNIPLPGVSWADTRELASLMCFKEELLDNEREPYLFKNHPNLTARMRSILFDWIMEVCDVYKLRRVTYYLAIDLVDRYLSRVEGLPKNQLQLLGITCLFIAAKVEETYPPKLAELAYVTDGACTEQDMLLVEISVLRVLKWNVNPLTVTGWLNLYMQICYDSKNSRDCLKYRKMMNDDFIYPQFSAYNFVRASQLTDLCSLDEGMLLFQYSVIAASAMYYIFNRERALYVSGYSWEQIRECVAWMGPFHQVANQQAVSSACEGPKERHRGSGGLKKLNPKILVSEIHCVQTHSVSLKMLEDVYQLNGSESETNLVDTELEDLPSAATPESTEESITDDTSNTNGHRESNSRLTFEIDDTLLDAVEIPFDVKNDENCDLFKDSNDEYNHFEQVQ